MSSFKKSLLIGLLVFGPLYGVFMALWHWFADGENLPVETRIVGAAAFLLLGPVVGLIWGAVFGAFVRFFPWRRKRA